MNSYDRHQLTARELYREEPLTLSQFFGAVFAAAALWAIVFFLFSL